MSHLPPASPAADSGPRVSDEFRSLRRSRSDRVVAGVLGGLGRRLGIDPVVLRVATVVLSIFGGVGVVLYAIFWLVVPAEDEERSILDQALGRGENRRPGTRPLALLLAGIGMVAGVSIVAGSWDSGVLLLLAVLGVYLLLRRRTDEDERAGYDTPPDEAGFGAYVYDPTVAPAPGGAGATTTATTSTDAAPAGPAVAPPAEPGGPAGPAGPTSGWPEGPDWGPPQAPTPVYEPPAPPPAKQRSVLGLITFCLALLSVGVLAVNDATWAEYPPGVYVAVPLGIVALGLLVGAWYGRSRGLIVLGFLLSIALVPATWLSQWDYHNSGDITRTYLTAEQFPREPQEFGAGDIRFDLAGLTLTDGQTVHLDVEQGAGSLTIELPPDVDVRIEQASVGAGDLTYFNEGQEGLGQEIKDYTDNGRDGPGGGTLVLDLELGLGNLEVTR